VDRILPSGEWHLRRLVRELVEHYHQERNHQGIGNERWTARLRNRRLAPSDAVNESVGFSVTTIGQPRRTEHNGVVGQYGATFEYGTLRA
jgi:hypothetical protein